MVPFSRPATVAVVPNPTTPSTTGRDKPNYQKHRGKQNGGAQAMDRSGTRPTIIGRCSHRVSCLDVTGRVHLRADGCP